MATYDYKCKYIAIQNLKCVFWMSGLVLWVSGLVLLVSGLVLGVWACIFGVWICILGVWTCIWVPGLVFGCLDFYLDVWTRILDTVHL